MAYLGNDRRVHRVFVTRNTEYHVRASTCVAVRDRRSGDWLHGHLAVRSHVSGGLTFRENGGILPTENLPRVGESLFFVLGERDLVTSPVIAIERPSKDVVGRYG